MALRGAISGFGEVAANAHLAGWRTRPEVNIVAVHDPISARRHQALRLIKNVRVYDDLELMLDGERLDFLDVASPPAFHGAAVRMGLAAGAHVLVEKPLCLEAKEFHELAATAAAHSRVLMCVHNWKHAPAYRRAHELVRSGRLGELRYLSLMRLRAQPAGSHATTGVGDPWRISAKRGGGILVDHGWHIFYLMQWLMGGERPARISSRLSFQPGEEVDDLADLRVEFPGNRIAYAHLSWRAPVRRTSATLYGDEGMLEIEGGRALLTGRSGQSLDVAVDDAPDDSYHAAWFGGTAAEFELALTEGQGSAIARENLTEALSAIELTAAARESAKSGEVSLTV